MQDYLLVSPENILTWSNEWILPPHNFNNLTVFSIYYSNDTQNLILRGADGIFITKSKGQMQTASDFKVGKKFEFPSRMNIFYQDSLLLKSEDSRKSYTFRNNYLEAVLDSTMCSSDRPKPNFDGRCMSRYGINLVRKGLLRLCMIN